MSKPSCRRSFQVCLAVVAAVGGGMQTAQAQFAAQNTQLLSHIPLSGFSGAPSSGNDCWGYVSPSGREYALMGLRNSLAVVEVTNPVAPVIVGQITHTSSLWGDVKTYQHYCYVSNESGGGIDVIDLSQVDNGIVTLVQRLTVGGLSTVHNVVINPDSGYLYLSGANLGGGRLMALSLANPANPVIAGQVASGVGTYSHDAQVVTYTSGPYAGKEIAFSCNGGTGLDIYDVTDKSNMFRLSRSVYSNLSYCHQAWLSEDRQYLYVNDETDGVNETVIFDVSDLSNPALVNTYNSGILATDHNLYVKGQFIFESDYRGGARIFCAADPAHPVQVGWFDSYPANDSTGYNGAWSLYPYFPSGILIISDIESGLFVIDPTQALSAGTLMYQYPEGRPTLSDPDNGAVIRTAISSACGAAGSPEFPTLHYNAGFGYESVLMSQVKGDLYEAMLPAAECGTEIRYYISAGIPGGAVVTDPAGAPATTYSVVAATTIAELLNDNFETNTGWVPTNLGATAGFWERGVPVVDPTWNYSPPADADGSGQCWLTGNVFGNSDVDSGAVRLTSPVFDLTGGNVEVSYYYYLRLTNNDGNDKLLVEMSSNGDAGPWIVVAQYTTDSGGHANSLHEGAVWDRANLHEDALRAMGLVMTSNMKIRFTAIDGGTQTIVEAAVDGFKVRRYECTPQCTPPDTNCDGSVNVTDLLTVINGWGNCPSPPAECPGDVTGDSTVDVSDLLMVINNWT